MAELQGLQRIHIAVANQITRLKVGGGHIAILEPISSFPGAAFIYAQQ